jgi:predicted AlkP superfamily phosphohydrolase/phosphomutase
LGLLRLVLRGRKALLVLKALKANQVHKVSREIQEIPGPKGLRVQKARKVRREIPESAALVKPSLSGRCLSRW